MVQLCNAVLAPKNLSPKATHSSCPQTDNEQGKRPITCATHTFFIQRHDQSLRCCSRHSQASQHTLGWHKGFFSAFLAATSSHCSGQQHQAAGEAPAPGQEEEAGGRRLEALGPRPTELCCVCRQHAQKLTNLPINSYSA